MLLGALNHAAHAAQPVEHTVGLRCWEVRDEVSHAIVEVAHDDTAAFACFFVTLFERHLRTLFSQAASDRSQTSRSLDERDFEHRGLIGSAAHDGVNAASDPNDSPRIDDHRGVAQRQLSLGERLTDSPVVAVQICCVREMPLDGPLTQLQTRGNFSSHSPIGQLAARPARSTTLPIGPLKRCDIKGLHEERHPLGLNFTKTPLNDLKPCEHMVKREDVRARTPKRTLGTSIDGHERSMAGTSDIDGWPGTYQTPDTRMCERPDL